MIEWRFDFSQGDKPVEICGVSVLDFDADGRVARHRDFWDEAGSQYVKLPVVGCVIRRLGGLSA